MATTFPVGADTSKAVSDIDKLIAELRKAGKEAGLTTDQVNKITESTKKASTQGVESVGDLGKSFGDFNNTLKTVGGAIGALFALDKIKAFVGEVINISSEFQKFAAVLTNTLGSQSQAQQALTMIQKFAAATPFSVRELTDSFVKLANQGFKPTIQQLRQLGDLASSTGKGFDQLTEAILDAQTGQFERLKEFGIKASKEGDNVTFSFKGVETQVKFTSDAMRDYVLSLGDLKGVSGAMAAISETLGGKISNLGDAYDNFLKTVGEGNNGILSDAVSLLNRMIADMTMAVKTKAQFAAEAASTQQQSDVARFDAFAKAYDDRKKAEQIYLQLLDDEEAKLKAINEENHKKGTVDNSNYDRIEAIRTERDNLNELFEIEKKEEAQQSQKKKAESLKVSAEWLKKVAAFEKEAADYVKYHAGAIELEIQETMKLEEAQLRQMAAAGGKSALGQKDKFSEPVDEVVDTGGPDNLDMSQLHADHTAEERAEREHQHEINAIRQAGFNFAANLVQGLFTMEMNNYSAEMNALNSKYDQDILAAGNNTKAKQAIEAEYNRKKKEIQIKQAQAQKEQAIFNIILGTAESIARVLDNPILIAIASAIGAIQLLTAASTPIPKFAKGVFNLLGPGSDTSDNILSLLSPGESVVSAKKSRKFADVLRPMVERDDFDFYDLKSIVDRKLPGSASAELALIKGLGNIEMADRMEELIEVLKSKPVSNVNIDERGLYVYLNRENYKSKTYKQRIRWTE